MSLSGVFNRSLNILSVPCERYALPPGLSTNRAKLISASFHTAIGVALQLYNPNIFLRIRDNQYSFSPMNEAPFYLFNVFIVSFYIIPGCALALKSIINIYNHPKNG